MLSSRSFIVSHFTSRSVIHFELITVKNGRSVSRTHTGLDVPAPFDEETIFAPLYCLCSFVKDQLTIFMGVYFMGSLFCSIDIFVFCQYHTVLITVAL